jgi:hypothetical protein
MLNAPLQAMEAMESHLEDQMLAGFGALRVVRDEEETRRPQNVIRILFIRLLLANRIPTRLELSGHQREKDKAEHEEEKER